MTVGVVGLGLIGGSIGLGLRDPSRAIVGFEPNQVNASLALERGCVDRLEPIDQVAQADVVFVAAPPAKVVEVLDAIQKSKGPNTIVTDCTSVKKIVADWAQANGERQFVPGHPMAGHEKSGPGFASAWMFRGARWILSPLPITLPSAVDQVESLVKSLGAVPIRVPAEHHDRHVAVVSHLPHAVAGLLVLLGDQLEDKDTAGGSWRDLTRVGGVDPGLWTQIFMANRVELGKVLGAMSSRMAELESNLRSGDEEAVRTFFIEAQEAKAKSSSSTSSHTNTPSHKNAAGRKRK